jgi:hypothetical protein
MFTYTQKQGQYLAFIYHYTKVNKQPPAEADFQSFFSVTPSAVHQMILTLEKLGFISREPGKARTIKVLLSREQLPYLEWWGYAAIFQAGLLGRDEVLTELLEAISGPMAFYQSLKDRGELKAPGE